MPDRAHRILKSFGEAIRTERLAKGLTQEQLAEKSDLSLNFVGNMERGEQMASLESVVRIAEAMGLKPSALLARAGL